MNRDALLASLIGFGIGLVITGALLLGPRVMKSLSNISFPKFGQSKQTPSNTPIPNATIMTTPTTGSFTIDSPFADAMVNKEELLVSGTSPADSTVVITGLNDESVTKATSDNKYSGKVLLTEGKNVIIVTSYINGKATSQTVTLYFSQDDF